MPREVFLPPDGSPFLHNTQSQRQSNFADNSDMDTSLPGLSSRYFQHDTSNDNLNSSRGLAGLDDISLGMDDDTTPMRFPPSESDEMLMGVNGGEFLADDSAMGFDTPLVSKTIKTRSKLNQSTSVPPAVAEEPEPGIEQPVKAEKPKRKKSTRSRSSSPTKKQPTPESTLETNAETAFPHAPMETMAEEPEPEPEPEPVVKPRRTSPRKPRARPPSTADPLPAFPSTRSSASPFAAAPIPPAPEPVPIVETIPVAEPVSQATEPEPEAEPVPAAKPKRTSRTVGRSKSKTRSKSVRAEETEDPNLGSSEKESSPAVAEEEPPAPAVQQALPLVEDIAPPVTVMEKAKSPPAQASAPSKPPSATVRHSIATSQAPEPHTRVQSGPAPFKFTRPSIAKSRNKSMSFTPPSSSPPVSAAAPVLDTPEDATVSKEEQREPTKEEEAEAIAAAMRITRRDSLVFPRPGQPYSFNLLGEPIQNSSEPVPAPTGADSIQPEPVPKRTRVGRSSTRVRGGAGIAAGRGGVDEKIEEEGQDAAPEETVQVDEVVSEPATASVEEVTSSEAQTGFEAIDQDVPMDEDQPEVVEDVAVPVNFGSRSPSPAPGPTPAEPSAPTPLRNEVASPPPAVVAPTPEANLPKATNVPSKARTTRVSLPAQTSRVSAPATRSSRRSEGRPVVTRAGSGMGPSRQKKDAIVEEKDEEEAEVPKEETVEESAVTESVETTLASEVPSEEMTEPAAPVDAPEPVEVAQTPAEEAPEAKPEPDSEPAEDVSVKPATRKATTQQKGLGVSAAKGPQRTAQRNATTSAQGAASTGPQRSGARAPRVASDSQKPSSGKPASATSAPMRATVSAPLKPAPSKAAAPSSGSTTATGRPQRVVSSQKPSSTTTAPQKPSLSASQKPASSQKPGVPARVAVSKAKAGFNKEPSPVVGKAPQAAPNKATTDEAPNAGVRATRALPKRAARMSKEQKMASVEGSVEVASAGPVEEREMEPESTNNESLVAEELKPDSPKPDLSDNNLAWLNAAVGSTSNQPDTSNAPTNLDAETSGTFVSNKRRASTPEHDTGVDAFESPSKRVRFSANLEAGPTPGPSRTAVQRQPKSNLKVKAIAKPKFQLKASRPKSKPKPKPKRTLTRDGAPGAMPSYAAPLKRTVSEKVETEAADSENSRPPLSESQTNTRSTLDKPKPTVPVAFTFRSELRLKPHVPEVPLPAAIPIALPMPDFAAAHAAAEAANLARRERAQAAFLEAQEALESSRQSKHEIGSETARRAAERAVFDAALKVKEAEAERVRVEERRLQEEREAIEIKEMRKRMVPKANPVPEFYKHLGQSEDGAGQEVEA